MAGRKRTLARVAAFCLAMGLMATCVYAGSQGESPLYRYSLMRTLERMEGQPAAASPARQTRAMTAVILAQSGDVPTVTPVVATQCPKQRTQCPALLTACPKPVATVCPQKTTQCPQQTTHCPMTKTTCPALPTRCPAAATTCPADETNCPQQSTRCPNTATSCPLRRTACPQNATACPPVDPTICPQKTTQCPSGATYCPMVKTSCPARGTMCPVSDTTCPADTTRCPYHMTRCPRTEPTICPEKTTKCPVDPTRCPGGATNCPIENTKCPRQDTVCDGSGGTSCLTPGTSITFIDPFGDPTVDATAEVAYDTQTPSQLRVLITVTATAPGVAGITDKIRACMSGLNGSTLSWETTGGANSPWVGTAGGRPAAANTTMGKAVYNAGTGEYECVAVYTGLPPNNQDFGAHMVWAQIVDGTTIVATVQQDIEVFYPRWGFNHAGIGANPRMPTWFHYWSTGGVLTGGSHTWEYEEDLTGMYYGFYVQGENHVNVSWLGAYGNAPYTVTHRYTSQQITVGGSGVGPHCTAEVITHEECHKQIYETWANLILLAHGDGPDDGDPYDDPDLDGIPNNQELGFMNITTDRNHPDTYDLATAIAAGYATYGDEEVRCLRAEETPDVTVDDTIDWAFPGTNTVNVYTPGNFGFPPPPWP